jgi:hypothetical protein
MREGQTESGEKTHAQLGWLYKLQDAFGQENHTNDDPDQDHGEIAPHSSLPASLLS